MPEAKLASLPAADPGSPGFRSVQPESIFQRVVKPALRATVSVVCAGSIAIQSFTVSGYAQSPPPESGLTDLGQGLSDHPLRCSVAAQPGTCPVEENPGAGSSNTAYAVSSPSGASTSYTVNLATQLHTAQTQTEASYQEAPEPGEPDWTPNQWDGLDIFNQLLSGVYGIGSAATLWMLHDIIITTIDGGVLKKHPAAQTAVAWSSYAFVSFVLLLIKIKVQWLIYVSLRKGKFFEKQYPKQGEKLARTVANVMSLLLGSAILVLATYVKNKVEREFQDSAKPDGTLDYTDFGRKLRSTIVSKPGKAGTIFSRISRAVHDAKLITENGVTYLILRPVLDGHYWTKTELPIDIPKDDKVHQLQKYVWAPDPSTKKYYWKKDGWLKINFSTGAEVPAKVVADGNSIWMLIGRKGEGYKIFKARQHDSPVLFLNAVFAATRVPGEAIDLYPGEEYVWATNALDEVYACKQPCDDGKWIKMGAKGRQVVVAPQWNPFLETTKGNTNNVWLKDGNGIIWSRPEGLVTTSTHDWLNFSSKYRQWIPQRVHDFFKAKPTRKNDWVDRDTMWPRSPFYPYESMSD